MAEKHAQQHGRDVLLIIDDLSGLCDAWQTAGNMQKSSQTVVIVVVVFGGDIVAVVL